MNKSTNIKAFTLPTYHKRLLPKDFCSGKMQVFYITRGKSIALLKRDQKPTPNLWGFVNIHSLLKSETLGGKVSITSRLTFASYSAQESITKALTNEREVLSASNVWEILRYYHEKYAGLEYDLEKKDYVDPVKPVCKQQPIVWNMDDMNALNKCIEERWLPLSKKNTDHDLEVLPECALCTLAKRRGDRIAEDGCDHCIIKQDTGRGRCKGTPHDDWYWAPFKKNMTAAQAELKYLKELRMRLLSQKCDD